MTFEELLEKIDVPYRKNTGDGWHEVKITCTCGKVHTYNENDQYHTYLEAMKDTWAVMEEQRLRDMALSDLVNLAYPEKKGDGPFFHQIHQKFDLMTNVCDDYYHSRAKEMKNFLINKIKIDQYD